MEETKRKSFIFYTTYNKVMRKLAPEDQLLYIHTICDYYFEGVPIPETTGSIQVDIALASIEEVMAANDKRYRNAIKGGAPKGNNNASKNNQNQPKTTENNQKQPNLNSVDLENNQNQTRLNYKTTENESGCIAKQPNDKEKEKDNVKEKEKEKEVGCFSSSSSQEIVIEITNDANKYPEMLRGSEYRDVRGEYEDVIWLDDVQDKSDDYWNSFDVHVKIDGFWSIERFVQYLSRHHSCSMFSVPSSFPEGLRNRIKAEVNKYCPNMRYLED